jgi:hypothetical protein
MRVITDHQTNDVNENLILEAEEELGPGGAPHHYRITIVKKDGARDVIDLHFQNGPVLEAGTNGITHEVLTAINIDRLKHFQEGPYKCFENEKGLGAFHTALGWLKSRTVRRRENGTEGTMQGT